MTVKERIHRLVDELPEMEATRFLEQLEQSRPSSEDPLIPSETVDERRAKVFALAGKYADTIPSSDYFLQLKRDEVDMEEAKAKRFNGSGSP